MSNRFSDRQVAPGSADTPPAVVIQQKSGTSALTSVASANATTTLLAANTSRVGATIFNDSTANLYLALGAGATASVCTLKMAAGSYYEVPFGYTGIITGFWDAVNGNARITQLTP